MWRFFFRSSSTTPAAQPTASPSSTQLGSSASLSLLNVSMTETPLSENGEDVLQVYRQPEGDQRGSNRPVILVFGWFKSRARHVSKYSAIYHRAGYEVVQVSFMGNQPAWGAEHRLRTALLALRGLRKGPELPDILIHTFSNGGLKHYLEFLALADEDPDVAAWCPKLRGVVVDSAPAKLTFAAMAGAFTGDMPSGWRKTLSYAAVYLYALVVRGIFDFLRGIDRVKAFGLPLMLRPSAWHREVPHLYLYSDSDSITNADYVTEFIEKHRAVGTPVSSVLFHNSPHVAHLLTHKEKYTQSVLDFLGRVTGDTSDGEGKKDK